MLESARNPLNYLAARLARRILSDYPQARHVLAAHAHRQVTIAVGPMVATLGITTDGSMEPAGQGNAVPAVAFTIPLAVLPRLLRKDESAFREVTFSGDSELAHVLSMIARDVEWDIEEDISRMLGGGITADIVAHRAAGGVQAAAALRDHAGQRLAENLAEYLVHERNAFITSDDLECLARDNESLRDAVARLEARLHILSPSQSKAP
jgi:ubiquinone biosynthesis protein UbiJ